MKSRAKIFVVCLLLSSCAFLQESNAQTSGGTSAPRLTMQGAAEQSRAPIIRDALGRPCLNVEAAARAGVVNPEMLDHVVSLKNNCPRVIRAKVCYFHAEHCNDLVVQGYSRVDTILGTIRNVKTFRYSVFQK